MSEASSFAPRGGGFLLFGKGEPGKGEEGRGKREGGRGKRRCSEIFRNARARICVTQWKRRPRPGPIGRSELLTIVGRSSIDLVRCSSRGARRWRMPS